MYAQVKYELPCISYSNCTQVPVHTLQVTKKSCYRIVRHNTSQLNLSFILFKSRCPPEQNSSTACSVWRRYLWVVSGSYRHVFSPGINNNNAEHTTRNSQSTRYQILLDLYGHKLLIIIRT